MNTTDLMEFNECKELSSSSAMPINATFSVFSSYFKLHAVEESARPPGSQHDGVLPY